MPEFTDRSVLVTGGSRGIGAAIATHLAARGARVAVAFQRDRDAADQTRAALKGEGHIVLQADVASGSEAKALVEQCISEFGQLDIVVNNAGVFSAHPIAAVSFEEWQSAWRSTLDTNLVGPANVSYAAARHMIERGHGKIVNVSSRGAFRGEPDAPAYGASKAGLNALTQSLAVALAPHGVFVAAVAPGFVDTDMAASSLVGETGDGIRRQSPLGRVGRAAEVAKAVAFLASDDIDFVTGAIVDVNGASYLRS
ncbi:MAG: SDR family oxidoreductase [Pseudomonadota bacterium]